MVYKIHTKTLDEITKEERELNNKAYEDSIKQLKKNYNGRYAVIMNGEIYVADIANKAAEDACDDHENARHAILLRL